GNRSPPDRTGWSGTKLMESRAGGVDFAPSKSNSRRRDTEITRDPTVLPGVAGSVQGRQSHARFPLPSQPVATPAIARARQPTPNATMFQMVATRTISQGTTL